MLFMLRRNCMFSCSNLFINCKTKNKQESYVKLLILSFIYKKKKKNETELHKYNNKIVYS